MTVEEPKESPQRITPNDTQLNEPGTAPKVERRRGLGFVNCAPYGGGMLVKGPVAMPRYCYAPASARTIKRVKEMESACANYGVPLAAAALQYSTRDGRVASTVVGMSDPTRVDQTVRLLETPIPNALWAILEPLAAEGRNGFA